jgi:hypothetical protein
VSRGGDYLLTLKADQRKAHAEMRDWFATNGLAPGALLRPCFDASDEGHGRLVRRRVFACTDLGPFAAIADWPGSVKLELAWRGRSAAERPPVLSLDPVDACLVSALIGAGGRAACR